MAIYPKGRPRDALPVLLPDAHPDVCAAVSRNSQLLGGQNFVYVLDNEAGIIKLTDCPATDVVFESLKQKPCAGLPEIYECYGHVGSYEGRALYAYKLKKYKLIERDDKQFEARSSLCSDMKNVIETYMREKLKCRGAEYSSNILKLTAAQWAEICLGFYSEQTVIQNNLVDCFKRLAETLRQGEENLWGIDYGNWENWMMDCGGQLVLVDPVSSPPTC